AAVGAELRRLIENVLTDRTDTLRRGGSGAARRRQGAKDLRQGGGVLAVVAPIQSDAKMLIVLQAQDQTKGRFCAERLYRNAGHPRNRGQREGVRQDFAWTSVFGMNMLQNKAPFGQTDIDIGREKGFQPDIEFAAPSARDPPAREGQQLLVAFDDLLH